MEFWSETRKNKTPHIMLNIRVSFIGEAGEIRQLLPIEDHRKSRILVRKWFIQGVNLHMVLEGRLTGWYLSTENGGRETLVFRNQPLNNTRERLN